MGYKHYVFKLNEWQFIPKWSGFWLHVTPADEDSPMEVWFGFAFWQFRGYCWGAN
jgi:hypothetical protein